MTLKLPDLDDRTFDDLRRQAFAVIDQHCPDWTDRSPSDPGITLVEVFAHLTEVMIFRLNRLPDKVHYALLDLLGVAPQAPAAAEATLRFSRSGSGAAERDGAAIEIPAGTLIADEAGSLAFATLSDLRLGPVADGGTVTGEVEAIHAERVSAELVGLGTGEAGQSFAVRRGPMLRRPLDPYAVVVGVEALSGEIDAAAERWQVEGRTFVLWREVASFSGSGPSSLVYVADRAAGTVTFGPATRAGEAGRGLGARPPAGAEIRVWYFRGGGRRGNVGPGILKVPKSPLRDVTVLNPERAAGGEDQEPLDRAVARGREAVRVLKAAVTARDFETVACETPGIARAKAYAQRDIWSFGRPGTVDVLVVPAIEGADPATGVTAAVLLEHQTGRLLAAARELVQRHAPVGVEARVDWVRCRPVDVSARVVLSTVEDADAVRARLERRLHALLAPDGAWPFGRPLRASDLYETFLSEPGVRYAERLTFRIGDAPSADIVDLHRDLSGSNALYAAGPALHRSLDGGESWALLLERPGESFVGVKTAADLPGYLAAFTRRTAEGAGGSVVYVSKTGGESFRDDRTSAGGAEDLLRFAFDFEIRDVAWTLRDEVPVLLVAGRSLLHRIRFSAPVNIDILPVRGDDAAAGEEDRRGFEAVAAARHVSRLEFVAVAARERLGVYLSAGGGPFHLLPDTLGKNIRVLSFQQQGNETFLWAGLSADKGEPGAGALRIGMRIDGGYDPTSWQAFQAGWAGAAGGSCEALDFCDDLVAAGTNRSGILTWRIGKDAAWSAPPALDCGLPLVDERRSLAPARGVALLARADGPPSVLTGGQGGLFRSLDLGRSYRANGAREFSDRVPLPRNWLFCSGRIDLEIATEAGGES